MCGAVRCGAVGGGAGLLSGTEPLQAASGGRHRSSNRPSLCVHVCVRASVQVHDWSRAGKHGLIAQLVRAVLPVIERGDADAE